MKKGQLFHWHQEIENWQKQNSILVVFNRSRINDFYKEHGLRLNSLMKEINELQKHYYVIEGDEINGFQIKQAEGKPMLLEGKTQEDANQAWADLMNQFVADGLKLIKV